MHWLRKLGRTVYMLSCLFMARMFGTYRHSVSSELDYAVYSWRGKTYAIPTNTIEE